MNKIKITNKTIIIASIIAVLTVAAIIVVICLSGKKNAGDVDASEEPSSVIDLDLSEEPTPVLPTATPEPKSETEPSESKSDTGIEIVSETEAPPEVKIPDSSEGNTPIVSDTGLLAGMAAGTILGAGTVTADNYTQYFYYLPIPTEVYNSMLGKSYVENNDISIDNLRYVRVIHYNFNHEIQVGELVVNEAIADDAIGIFRELYENEYEVQSMFLVDRYWTGDGETTDSASIDVNNTSCFLYRKATGSSKLSKHAYGMAIDINPQQNPYVSYKTGSPVWSHSNADPYIDRTTGLPHVITEGDVCYNIFAKYGFSWGGNWKTTKDYQHFQK